MMAYGTPRAVRWQGYYYDTPCVRNLVAEGKIIPYQTTLDDLAHRFHYLLLWKGETPVWTDTERDYELTYGFIETLMSKALLVVEDIILEGQDQFILQEYACSRCEKLLTERCTDY